MPLEVGKPVPEFETIDESGNVISHEDLLGCASVIYFYPKDGTSFCTKEACDFRDNMHALDNEGIVVLGISPDDAASHRQFADQHMLNFSLIPDPKKELCRLFKVMKKGADGSETLERTTFIVDDKGIIRWIERPVEVEGHVHRVLKAIDSLKLG